MRRVVITGLGPITPIGIGKEAFWEAIKNKKSGIGPVSTFDASIFKATSAGEILNWSPEGIFPPHRLKRLDRYAQFSVASVKLALEDSGLNYSPDLPHDRVGVSFGTALGGVAGHSGLFGTAAGVGAFARRVLQGARGDRSIPAPFSPSLVARLTTKSSVPGTSRALGWDTMLPTSSCGTRLSPAAFGHVGFTGTSLWIDPALDRYFVLLTNRVCGGGTLAQMRDVRRAFHDALARL